MDKYDKIKLENQICFPLYALSREIIKLYKPILKKYNLTYTQYVTMLVIWEVEKIDFKELGKRLHLDSGTLTPVINKLVSMGLVIKYRNEKDDRLVTIELAEKGKLLKEDILEVPEQIFCTFDGDAEDVMMLKKYLDKFLDLLNSK
ncbi:MarR family winged helix-turn-helix transcriptional regulator [Dethiothermospora halolimnae]|uniref:MarR family winged helix-turn-helix transcriptional regulator n=1 Tax=Dethiothermospora halolimnae TaxID=3114390 RepID=UPI003CCB89E8